MSFIIPRPAADEYAPFYAGYIAGVTAEDVLSLLADQMEELGALFGNMTEKQALYRYAPDKWSIVQLLEHLCDAERIFSYRALRFSRNDVTPLASFDENEYSTAGKAERTPLAILLEELLLLRRANLLFFRGLNAAELERRGVASGAEISVRALVYVTAGHMAHHLRILRERYM